MSGGDLVPPDGRAVAAAPVTAAAGTAAAGPAAAGPAAARVAAAIDGLRRPDAFLRPLAVTVLYVAAARLMMLDPWFTGDSFSWRQSSVITLLGLLMVSAIAFEWHLLGLSRGMNLVAQIALAYPFTLFVTRLLGRPWFDDGGGGGVIGAVLAAARVAAGAIGIDRFVPAWLSDALASPGTAIVLLAVCVATSVGGNVATRIGLTTALFFIPLAVAFSRQPPPSLAFLAGVAGMLGGMCLQFRDVEKYHRDREILRRLRHVTDELERRACLRLVSRTWEDGRLGEVTAEGIVRQTYEHLPGVDAATVRDVTRGITRDLVTTHGLLEVRHDAEGIFLVPPPALEFEADVLEQVARLPRMVIVFLLAGVWVMMPFDLVPDAIPVVGAVDDVIVMTLAGWPLSRLLEQRIEKRRRR
jgi:hypothetical protein